MTEQTTLAPVIRKAGEGEKRWFFGGGVFTWKLSSVNQDIGLWEVDMVEGKWTPIHTHPVSESMWVLDGQIQYRVNDDEHELGAGSDLDEVGRDVEPGIRVDELDGDDLLPWTSWTCRSRAVEPAVDDEHERGDNHGADGREATDEDLALHDASISSTTVLEN